MYSTSMVVENSPKDSHIRHFNLSFDRFVFILVKRERKFNDLNSKMFCITKKITKGKTKNIIRAKIDTSCQHSSNSNA